MIVRFPTDHVYNRQIPFVPLHAQSADWVSRFFPATGAFTVWTSGTYGLPVMGMGPAWAAAGDAARAAAGDALKPTTIKLQASAHDLVRRMCAVGR